MQDPEFVNFPAKQKGLPLKFFFKILNKNDYHLRCYESISYAAPHRVVGVVEVFYLFFKNFLKNTKCNLG
jgi:hypothetical protein